MRWNGQPARETRSDSIRESRINAIGMVGDVGSLARIARDLEVGFDRWLRPTRPRASSLNALLRRVRQPTT